MWLSSVVGTYSPLFRSQKKVRDIITFSSFKSLKHFIFKNDVPCLEFTCTVGPGSVVVEREFFHFSLVEGTVCLKICYPSF